MRRYKNWSHKIGSWEYLTIWRPVLLVPTPNPAQTASFLHCILNSFQRILKVSSCSSTWINPCRGRQVDYYCLVAKFCLILCRPQDCSIPGSSVLHYLPKFAQTHVHQVDDAIQPSHPLLSPYLPTFNLSQHQGLFQWVSSLHQVAKVLVSPSASVLPMNIQDWFP